MSADAEPGAALGAAQQSVTVELKRWLPLGVVALGATFLLITSLGPLGNGLWFDEIHSVISYINPGPSGIWGGYTPNDHMLFELVAWATAAIIHDHSAAAYRIWGVLPAIAAVALLVRWTWHRLGAWTAALLAVLAATAPLHMALAVQARGYGIGFLASVVMLIGADGLNRAGSRRALVIFAAGSLAGIVDLIQFVMPFAALTALLMIRRELRRRLILMSAIVGVLSLAWYGPVISTALHETANVASSPVPLHSVYPRLLGDLLGPSINLLLPSLSLTPTRIAAACILAAAAVVVWRSGERMLTLLTIVPAFFTYLCFGLLRVDLASRYMSILLLPLLIPIAALLAIVGRWVAGRGRPLAIGAAAAAVALSVLMLSKADEYYRASVVPPIEDWKDAAAIVDASPGHFTATNSGNAPELNYYAHPAVPLVSPGRIATTMCSNAPLVYVEHTRAHQRQPSVACLIERRARLITLTQTRQRLSVWIVPRPTSPRIWCGSDFSIGAPATSVTAAMNRPFSVPLGRGGLASISILSVRRSPSIPAVHGPSLYARGSFVAIVYRFTNLGDKPVPATAIDPLVTITGWGFNLLRSPTGVITWSPLATGSGPCSPAVGRYAVSQGLFAPQRSVRPRRTVTTVALFAIPSPVQPEQSTPPATIGLTSAGWAISLPLGPADT